MTTSNPFPEPALRDWIPEPALIARLANEFFSALPVETTTQTVPLEPSVPEPAGVSPDGVVPSGEASVKEPSAVKGGGLPEGKIPPTVSEPVPASPFAQPASFSGFDFSFFSFPKAPSSAARGLEFQNLDAADLGEPAVPLPMLELDKEATPIPEGEKRPQEQPAREEGRVHSFEAFSFLPVATPAATTREDHPAFDAAWFKRDFPILQKAVSGKPLIWLDNAATTQKPQAVIDRLSYFYENENSNVHRAAHTLAARATDAYEGAREKVRRFLGASSAREIVFVRGATEAINLVAKAWGWQNIGEGDEILITHLEHHANIVPWQQLAGEKKAMLKVAPVDDQGRVILSEYEKLFTPRTRLVSFTQVSNALGTVTPAREMAEIAHRHGAKVLLDGAQSVSHQRVNVSSLDADFYVFSGHKVFGPTGIGVLYGKEEILNAMQPWQGGGNMIQDVTFERTLYQQAPARFEAGTGNIADAVGLGAALDYLDRVGLENVARYEHELLDYGTSLLKQVPGLHIIGTAPEKAGVLSFVIDGHKNEEISTALNREGIAVRAGHHCAQPILRRFGLEGTVRASLAFYNLPEDLEALTRVLCDLTGKGFGRF